MTGREYLINQVVLHILDSGSDVLTDLRIWECIEGEINKVKFHQNANSARHSQVLRYWDTSLLDPDGRATMRLVNEIRRGAEHRFIIRKNAAEARQRLLDADDARESGDDSDRLMFYLQDLRALGELTE